MDEETLILAKNYTNAQRVAYEEKINVTKTLSENMDADITAMGMNLYYISVHTPAKSELKHATIIVPLLGKEETLWIPEPPMIDNDIIYGVGVEGANMTTPFVVVVAYQSGTHNINVDGTDISLTIPKTGIYFATGGLEAEGVSYVKISWDHIKTIDPKYLPESCLTEVIDLDYYTVGTEDGGLLLLREVFGQLINDGGGKVVDYNEDVELTDPYKTLYKLFDALETNRAVRVEFTLGNFKVRIDGCAVIRNAAGEPVQLYFAYWCDAGTGSVFKVECLICKDDTGHYIQINVEVH